MKLNIYLCMYLCVFCDLQIQHHHSFYSLNWTLIYWYLLWTFLLRTTWPKGKNISCKAIPGSAGVLSPGLLKDLPGRSNSEFTLSVTQPEGKDSHSNCVENPIRAKCAMLFFPQPFLAQLWVSCLRTRGLAELP